ncbi:MAG: response regulator [Ignavibacteriae bacterium]|nr:response regulator [Ignavibacteriota bacterium]
MTKILVVEDDNAQLQLVLTILRTNGLEAIGASNGVDGAEMAKSYLPDLIISDIHMDRGGGYDLLASLRNDLRTASIPVIIMTAMAEKEGFRKSMEMGADDFLPKPFSPSVLLAAVNLRLQKHRLLMQKANQKLEELRKAMTFAIPHELQTPLNGILGYSDIVRKQHEDLETSEIAWMSERIYKNAKRLQRHLENYLLFAQLELKQTEFLTSAAHAETKDVDTMVDYVANDRAQEYGRVGDLQMNLGKGSVAITPNYFAKITSEVVDNALKFSKTGSPVFISAEDAKDGYFLTVTDRGRGMTTEQIKSIGAYVQFDRTIYEQQGLGLGLVVSKRLANLYGGDLFIQSEMNVGTTVRVKLPQAL